MNCLLCKSNNLIPVEKISVNDIIHAYKRYYNIEVSYLFNSDYLELFKCNDCDLLYFYPSITGDEKFYNSLQEYKWYYRINKEEFLLAQTYIRDTYKVLEVGSGSGEFAKTLRKEYYTGLDFSTKAKAMAAVNGIRIENESIEEYSINHFEEFDIVCFFQVLEHVKNPHEFLSSSINCLKKGGYLIVGVPSEESLLKYSSNNVLNIPPHHISRWTDKALKSISGILNLEVVSIYHENLANEHRIWYFNTLVIYRIKKLLNYKVKALDNSLMNSIISFAGRMISKILLLTNKNDNKITGESVIAIYKKK